MKFIVGKKIGMTQVFLENGNVVPVTRVQAGPCVVTQIKTKENDGVSSVQVGFGTQKVFRLSRAEQGHLKGISSAPGLTVRILREVPIVETMELKRGDVFSVKTFKQGEKIQVVGVSKGKGFQGVVRRHGFAGGPASHGHKDNLRMPGSIGAGGVQRVFKDMRMAGHMGSGQITVKNLEVVQVKDDVNELWIKGAIPGSRNSIVVISTPEGKIEIAEPEATPEAAPETTTEATPVVGVIEKIADTGTAETNATVSGDGVENSVEGSVGDSVEGRVEGSAEDNVKESAEEIKSDSEQTKVD